MMRRTIVALLALLAIGFTSGESRAFDLTGSWVGRLRCDSIDDEKLSFSQDEIVFIRQLSPSQVFLRLESEGGFGNHFTGAVQGSSADPEGRGILAVHRCFAFDANDAEGLLSRTVLRGTGRVDPESGSGSLRLDLTEIHSAGAKTATIVECVGNFTRLLDSPPTVDTCLE